MAPAATPEPPTPPSIEAAIAGIGATWIVQPTKLDMDKLIVTPTHFVWHEAKEEEDGGTTRVLARVPRGGGAVVRTKAEPNAFIAADASHVFWLESYGGCPKYDAPDSPRCRPFGYEVWKAPLAGGPRASLGRGLKNYESAITTDDKYVYFIESRFEDERVVRIAKTGGPMTTLADKQVGAYALRVVGDALYWVTGSDAKGWALVRLDKNVKDPQVVVRDKSAILSFTFDGATIFYSTKELRVLSVPIAGGTPKVLVAEAVPRIGGVTFRIDGTHLYWLHRASDERDAEKRIMRMPKEGGEPAVLFTDRRSFYEIAVDASSVWWVSHEPLAGNDPKPQSQWRQIISRVPKTGGPKTEVVRLPGASPVVDLQFDGEAHYLVNVGGGIARFAN